MGQAEMLPGYSNVVEERTYRLRLLGTGASDPVKQFGPGMAVTRTAAGVFKVVFSANPGNLVGFTWGLGDATPGNVKGMTVTRAPLDTTGGVYSVSVSLWSSAFAAAELAATNIADLWFTFSEE